jgi:1,5-anhydro-D-fructose reductase (1,5-anhydro-D-mannitol-forming)
MPLGWAIISTGRHPDQKMAPAINAAGSEIVAVVSRDRGRAQAFAEKHGVRTAYEDVGAMLRDPAVDVVYVASPNHLHAEHVVKAAAAGKHVLCEKPMALTREDCQQMIDACAQADVRLGVGFHLRYHPGHQRLREVVQDGSLGTVGLVQAQWVNGVRGQTAPPPRPPLQQWWEAPEMAGAGGFMGTGVHCADLLRYVLDDDVVEVSAITDGQRDDQPLEHLATLLLRFRSGTMGIIATGRRLPDSLNDIVVYGSDGRGGVHGSLFVSLQGRFYAVGENVNEEQSYEPPDPLSLYTKQVEAFNRSVEEGTEPVASGLDGLRAAEVTLAMVESARTGRLIRIE